MTTTITVSEARAALPQLIEAVQRGEEVTLTRHGIAVAVLLRPDRVRARRAEALLDEANALHDELEQARLAAPGPGLSKRRADELVADVRASRRRA